jgi:hypothetical protein
MHLVGHKILNLYIEKTVLLGKRDTTRYIYFAFIILAQSINKPMYVPFFDRKGGTFKKPKNLFDLFMPIFLGHGLAFLQTEPFPIVK